MSDDKPKPKLPERGYSGLFTVSPGKEPLDMSRVVPLRLPAALMDEFIARAEQHGISKAELLRQVVLEWLNEVGQIEED